MIMVMMVKSCCSHEVGYVVSIEGEIVGILPPSRQCRDREKMRNKIRCLMFALSLCFHFEQRIIN